MRHPAPDVPPPRFWEVSAAPRVRLYLFQPCEPEPGLDMQPAPEGAPPGSEPLAQRSERPS